MLLNSQVNFNDKDNTYFIGCSEITLNDDKGVKDVQILRIGEYKHPRFGTFKITPEVLKKFKENFDKNVRKIDLAFNYEHGESKAHGSTAAGWIKSLAIKNNDSELWATTDWTPSASKSITEKEYRYTSAEFFPKYTDAETGKSFDWVLIGAALTNTPFVKDMQAIAANETKTKPKGSKTMNLTELIAELAKLGIDFHEMKAKAAKFDLAETDKVKLTEELGEAAKEKLELEGKVTKLTEENKALAKVSSDIKFAELMKKGMDEGKITKVMAEGSFKKMFETNGAEFCETFLSEAEKIINTDDNKGNSGSGDDNKGKKASVILSEKAEKLAAEKKCDFSEALEIVEAAEPKLAEAYQKELDDAE